MLCFVSFFPCLRLGLLMTMIYDLFFIIIFIFLATDHRPFLNPSIGTGIGTDTTNTIISSSISPMDAKPSKVVI